MPSADASPRRSRLDAALGALTSALMVAAVGGVAWGIVAPSAGPSAGAAAEAPVPSAPTRLQVRSLGIDAEVVPIELGDDAVLEPPEDAGTVGWWDGSALPGARGGRIVITGHTLHDGEGALDRMVELRSGRVVLRTETGVRRYRVTDRIVADYATVAERARDIFGQTERSPDGARLILVTCTDFNGSVYESNVIVVAEPV